MIGKTKEFSFISDKTKTRITLISLAIGFLAAIAGSFSSYSTYPRNLRNFFEPITSDL